MKNRLKLVGVVAIAILSALFAAAVGAQDLGPRARVAVANSGNPR